MNSMSGLGSLDGIFGLDTLHLATLLGYYTLPGWNTQSIDSATQLGWDTWWERYAARLRLAGWIHLLLLLVGRTHMNIPRPSIYTSTTYSGNASQKREVTPVCDFLIA